MKLWVVAWACFVCLFCMLCLATCPATEQELSNDTRNFATFKLQAISGATHVVSNDSGHAFVKLNTLLPAIQKPWRMFLSNCNKRCSQISSGCSLPWCNLLSVWQKTLRSGMIWCYVRAHRISLLKNTKNHLKSSSGWWEVSNSQNMCRKLHQDPWILRKRIRILLKTSLVRLHP